MLALLRDLVARVLDQPPGRCAWCGRRPLPVDAVAAHVYPTAWFCGADCLAEWWAARQV